ncbi:hypothetical protein GOV06_00230, partial [Candidatus Woesearchaeota archaeon]|nr:hypothetical protein [Candidatus Woesearchaeota archaeon]
TMGMGKVSLKEMSRQGKITTDILIKAFERLGIKIDSMGDIWDTIDAAISRVTVQWQLLVYQMTKGNSAFKDFINSVADAIGFAREGMFGKINEDIERMVSSGASAEEIFIKMNESLSDNNKNVKETAQSYSSLELILSKGFSVLTGTTDAFASSTEELEKLDTKMKETDESQKTFIKSSSNLASVFGFYGLIPKIVTSLDDLSEASERTENSLQKTREGTSALGVMAEMSLSAHQLWAGLMKVIGSALSAKSAVGDLKTSIKTYGEFVSELSEYYKTIGAINLFEDLEGKREIFLRVVESLDVVKEKIKELKEEKALGGVTDSEYDFRMGLLSESLTNANDNLILVRQSMEAMDRVSGGVTKNLIKNFNTYASGLEDYSENKKQFEYEAEIKKLNDYVEAFAAAGKTTDEFLQKVDRSRSLIKIKFKDLFPTDELKKAQEELADLVKDGIGGQRLSDAIKKVNKLNGSTKALNEIKKNLNKTHKESMINYEFENRLLKVTNPLLYEYEKKKKDITHQENIGLITKKQMNKELAREKTLY